ncbi:MAG: tRNA lysidine(34) synthetase TilS [Acidobacteria bacterium]|nr:tRNA lysidine(34) synthetase TilS [Acidobacteriota bacterium]
MLSAVLKTIAHFCMIAPGQRVAVACSGGPDSTALLLVLYELSDQLGCALSVCHLNHCLRAEESDEDESFVRQLSERLQLPLHASRADVRSKAGSAKSNLESTARKIRYEFFRSLIDEGRADRVAVGHTADDQAETVLQRLLRGAGLRGLAGIYPVVENRIIRPLIEVRRSAVLAYLNERQQPWREDSSNLDLRRTRNRIRHQLVPMLSEFNPQIVRTLAGTAETARDEESFWAEYLPPILSQAAQVEGERISLNIQLMCRMHPAVRRRLLRCAIAAALYLPRLKCSLPEDSDKRWQELARLPQTGAADFEHIEQLLHLMSESQSGSWLPLPGGYVAKREFSHLIIEKAAAPKKFQGFEHHFHVPARIEAPEIGSTFSFEIMDMENAQARYNQSVVSLLDPGLGGTMLTLRNWRPGDLYKPAGHRTERKLKEFFRSQRIPLTQRQGWPVLLWNGRIVWTRGLGAADDFSPPPGSDRALLVMEFRR